PSKQRRTWLGQMMAGYLSLPRDIYVLCFGMFLSRATSFVTAFLALYVSTSLGFELSFATLALGVYGAGGVAACLVGGALSDRFGRRPIMILSLAGGALCLVALTELRSRGALLAGIAVLALITDLYRPSAWALVSDLTPVEQRPHAFSLTYVAMNLG